VNLFFAYQPQFCVLQFCIQWNFGDGTNRVLNQTSLDHTYNQEGTFEGFVEAVDLNGDKEVIPFTVVVQPSPFEINARIDIGAGAGAILEPGETIDFRLQLGGGTPPFSNIEWDFGDGTFDRSNSQFVSHVYNQAGNFSVVATVGDSAGRTAIATKGVIIQSRPIQFGDVAVTIEALSGTFDWRIRLQNLRGDVSIDGDSILRIFDAPGFGSRQHLSRRTGFFLSPGETESDFLINPSDLPVNQPLLLVAEFQEGVTQRLLGDATEQFTVIDSSEPPPPPPGNGNGVEPPPPPGNGVEPPPPVEQTEIVARDFKQQNISLTIPQFQVTRINPVNFTLPADAIRIQFARVFLKIKFDNFFSDADVRILLNGVNIANIDFLSREQNIFKQVDIEVTALVNLRNQNNLILELTTADIFGPGVATIELASVFVETEEPV